VGTRKTSEPFFACPTRPASADRERVDSGPSRLWLRRFRAGIVAATDGVTAPDGVTAAVPPAQRTRGAEECGGRLPRRPTHPGLAVGRRVSPWSARGGFASDTSSSVKGETRRLGNRRAGGARWSPCEEWSTTLARHWARAVPRMRYSAYLKPEESLPRSGVPSACEHLAVGARHASYARPLCGTHHLERSGQHHCLPQAASLRSSPGRAVGVRRSSQDRAAP
jgi:hypothetical protein